MVKGWASKILNTCLPPKVYPSGEEMCSSSRGSGMLLNGFQIIEVLNWHVYLLKTCNWPSMCRRSVLWIGKHCADWYLGLSIQWDPLYGLNGWGLLELVSWPSYETASLTAKDWGKIYLDASFFHLQWKVTEWKYKPKISFVKGDTSLRSVFVWSSEQNTPISHQKRFVSTLLHCLINFYGNWKF